MLDYRSGGESAIWPQAPGRSKPGRPAIPPCKKTSASRRPFDSKPADQPIDW
jgi:hypothetical protein